MSKGTTSSPISGVEEMNLKELNKNPLAHRSSYENYFIKVNLGEVDRAIYLLKEGDKIQKSAILKYLPSLFKHDLDGSIRNILEKYIFENLWKEQPSDQINIGKAMIKIVPLLPSRTVGRMFPFLQSMMSVKNEKVSSIFEEVFFTTVPYLPRECIEGDVCRFIVEKGSQFETERNRRFCSKFLGELCKRLSMKGRPGTGNDQPFLSSQSFTTLVVNLCQDTSYVVRKNMARNIEYIGRKLGENALVENGLMEELFQLIEDETKEVRIASFLTILNLLTDGLNDLYLRYTTDTDFADFRSSSHPRFRHHQHPSHRRRRIRRVTHPNLRGQGSSSEQVGFSSQMGSGGGSSRRSHHQSSSSSSSSSQSRSLLDMKDFFSEGFRRKKILPLFLSYFDHPPRDLYPELAQNFGLIFYKFVLRGDLLSSSSVSTVDSTSSNTSQTTTTAAAATTTTTTSSSSGGGRRTKKSKTRKSNQTRRRGRSTGRARSSGGAGNSSPSNRERVDSVDDGSGSNNNNLVFQTFFQNCCGDTSANIRLSCAFNFPAVLNGFGASKFVKAFLRCFRNLSRDESEEVRFRMATSFGVIVESLSMRHKSYALLGQTYLKGLNDPCERVQDKYFQQFSHVLSHFFLSLTDKLDRNNYIDFSTPSTSTTHNNPQISERERIRKIFHENFTRTIQLYERRITMDWRLGIRLFENLELCCEYFPSETLKEAFLPMAKKNLVNSAIPLRQVCQRVYVVMSRKLCNFSLQVSLMKNVCSELAKGRSCRERIAFLEIVPHVIDVYSKSFFKKYLMDHVLHLSYDKVPVVKKKFCRIIPSLNSILSPSKDVKYIAVLKERSSFLELDQELSVVEAAKEAKREIQAIELEVSRGRANQYSYHNQHEREDGKKEKEEKGWMEAEGGGGSKSKKREDKGSLNIEEEIKILQQKKYNASSSRGGKKRKGKKSGGKKRKGGYKRKKNIK